MDPNQDDYDLDSVEDTDTTEDGDEDDDVNLFILFLRYDFLLFLLHAKD